MRRVVAVPMDIRDFEALAVHGGQATVPLPATGPGAFPSHFAWRWFAGTFVPLMAAVVVSESLPDAPAGLFLMIGTAFLVTNLGLSIWTRGYRTGTLVPLGKTIAVVTGWIGLVLAGLSLLAVVVMIAVAALFVIGLLAALANSD